jgi:acetylornithine deacetylase/succinyl-diaminopimelate desuccinylase-like protein
MGFPGRRYSVSSIGSLIACGAALVIALAYAPATAAAPPDWKAVGNESAALLSRYIQVDTTNPPGNELKAAQFLKDVLDREGIEAQIFETTPGRGNVYARLKGDGSRKAVVLLNHLDVVPADKRFWNIDPFSGTIKDG